MNRDLARHVYQFGTPWPHHLVRLPAPVFRDENSWRLQYEKRRPGGHTCRRAARTDEALTVLDVQVVVGNCPRDSLIARRRPTLYFHEATFAVTTQWSPWPLELGSSRVGFGERWWWLCPLCSTHARLLYYFRVRGQIRPPGVVGCRRCLGLVYRSQAWHKSPAQDLIELKRGDDEARHRVRARQERIERENAALRSRIAELVKAVTSDSP